jgi:hypothetical protein
MCHRGLRCVTEESDVSQRTQVCHRGLRCPPSTGPLRWEPAEPGPQQAVGCRGRLSPCACQHAAEALSGTVACPSRDPSLPSAAFTLPPGFPLCTWLLHQGLEKSCSFKLSTQMGNRHECLQRGPRWALAWTWLPCVPTTYSFYNCLNTCRPRALPLCSSIIVLSLWDLHQPCLLCPALHVSVIHSLTLASPPPSPSLWLDESELLRIFIMNQ